MIAEDTLPSSDIIQRGCIELISLCLRANLGSLEIPRKPLIVEVTSTSPDLREYTEMLTILQDILHCVNPFWLSSENSHSILNMVRKYGFTADDLHERAYRISVFISNVITTTVKFLQARKESNDHEMVKMESLALVKLLEFSAAPLINGFAAALNKGDGAGIMIVAAACCQSLFHLVFALKEESISHVGDMLNVALKGLAASEPKVRLTSVKLIGACYALPHDRLSAAVDPLLFVQVKRALNASASMESDSEVRQVAYKLNTAFAS
ncbi:hypothetical protein BC829DRAFT_285982 [Chytridium lagenaria]|nr:hypothetical protein BC829DRAFT_285982 [Chytridium lagenaria]